MRKTLLLGTVLIAAALLVGACAPRLAATPTGTPQGGAAAAPEAVMRGQIEERVTAIGSVVADRQVTVAFTTSGRVAEVKVEEGQQVEFGEEMARLDTDALEWQVARARAGLDTARARLAQAQQPPSAEQLASAQAALDSARAAYEKVKAGPSAEDLAAAQAALDSARANYARVEAGPTAEDLAAAKAGLDGARAALKQAQAAYDQVKNRPDIGALPQSLALESATIDMQRAQAAYDALADHPTASELASAAAQVAQAEAQLAGLKERPTASELASAAAQVAQAEAQLAQLRAQPAPEDLAVVQAQVQEATVAFEQAQSQLEDARLTAPFAGTVLSVQVAEGGWATPGMPALVLAAEPFLVQVNIDEVDVAPVAAGQPVRLTFDALSGEVAGTVASVAASASNVGGAVAYVTEIGLEAGTLPLRLGMTANVEIAVARVDDALLVPNRAVTADRAAGRYYVTRQLADGATERVEVRIGLRDERNTQILEGLEEGDLVAVIQLAAQTTDETAEPFGTLRDLRGTNP